MLDNPEEFKNIVHTVIEIAKSENEHVLAELLENSQITISQTDNGGWNGEISYYTVYLNVDVNTFIRIKSRLDDIEKSLLDRFCVPIRHLDIEVIVKVALVPKTYKIGAVNPDPHRPFTTLEAKRREDLSKYLDTATEDELIEEILLPLFRQLGYHRITPAGHKDKALEYGKDIWMKFTLPTQHILYFGIQVKKGKLDAAGVSKNTNTNIAEIHNQVLMLLGHEVFDPELSRTVLVDHAFIIAGGEITKAARNWLGGQLDRAKRSQIMFMDREDILNLFIVTNLPLPAGALPKNAETDELPF